MRYSVLEERMISGVEGESETKWALHSKSFPWPDLSDQRFLSVIKPVNAPSGNSLPHKILKPSKRIASNRAINKYLPFKIP